MHRELAIALFLFFSTSTQAEEPPAKELWKLVAQSDLIIVGTPSVPTEQIDESERSGEHRYIDIPTRVKNCLKGDPCPETMVFRYFTRPAWHNPAPRNLVESNGNQSVLFLTYVDTQTITRAPEIYFAGHTPSALQPSSEELIRQVDAENRAQKEIINQFAQNFRPADEPSQVKVRALIEAMLERGAEKRAFAELEELGEAAVAAMILFMDDRRELPIKSISLRNKGSGNFEEFRHYGPQVVADAIAAILNQITGENFGTIANGASERERKAAIDGWRVYLHRKRFGASTAPD